MIFYVYLDPDIFSQAEDNAPYGSQALIAALRGFLQYCCVMEFDDYRVQEAIREKVEAMASSYDRKIITVLLETMAKRNRFIYCLSPDYMTNKSDLETMFEQAEQTLIDLALLEAAPEEGAAVPSSLQIATLENYQSSEFEKTRSHLAGVGSTPAPGSMGNEEFLNTHFLKGLKHAAKIEICDRVFGDRFGDNFRYTVQEMIKWLSTVLIDPSNTELHFHCGEPRECTRDFLISELEKSRDKHVEGLPVHIHIYDTTDNQNPLPPDRFIITDQVCLSIGRGMDFLDRNTGKNRDVSINIASEKECLDTLKSFEANKIDKIKL